VTRLPLRLLTLSTSLVTVFAGALASAPTSAADDGSGNGGGKAALTSKVEPDGEYDHLPHGRTRSPAREARAAARTPTTRFEMPFPCGQTWTGTTRPSHSPSPLSVDWNRTDDLGDPVVASAPGLVTSAYGYVNGGYGKWVVIDHGGGETTLYAHLSAVAVKAGERVDQGQQIGNVGTTGNSTGPHLHFEERYNGSDMAPYFHGAKFSFGTSLTSQNCVDVPLSANLIGGPVSELVVFRRTAVGKFRVRRSGKSPKVIRLGKGTDDPVLGDWNGSGRANVGVRDAATRTFTLRVGKQKTTIVFGAKKDKPVAGDWNGDGTWEVGVRRSTDSTFRLRAADGTVSVVKLGKPSDLPVTGDWDGDGTTDLGVYDQSTATFTLRLVDADGIVWTADVPFGRSGDLPVVGDWDGNGKTDLGAWDPARAVFSQRLAPAATSTARQVVGVRFGWRR
jgi:murein DD-endopeptidase MepM/ murein hydrolase activator NlpD